MKLSPVRKNTRRYTRAWKARSSKNTQNHTHLKRTHLIERKIQHKSVSHRNSSLLLQQTFHGGEALDEPSALIRDLDIFDLSRFMTLYNRCHFT